MTVAIVDYGSGNLHSAAKAFERAAAEYEIDRDELPIEALVALTMTFAQGYALERLEGIAEGHDELLDWIERWLQSLEQRDRRAA